jgi:hypothetical protein
MAKLVSFRKNARLSLALRVDELRAGVSKSTGSWDGLEDGNKFRYHLVMTDIAMV